MTVYTNTSLTPATTYYYRVRSYNSKGNSAYVAVASTTTQPVAAPCTDNIAVSSSPSGRGSATGGGAVSCNSSVTVSASANPCYNFVNWTENGTVVSSSASHSFTANANRSLVANFAAIP